MFFNNYLSSYFVFCSSGKNLSIPILTFVGIIIGQVLSTMFSVTGKLLIDKQENAIKDYFHFYKVYKNWK